MTVLVTAGPTRAYFDDVRYLSNLSSGALGYAICESLLTKGCRVLAVVGDTKLPFEDLGLASLVRVETNREMRDAVIRLSKTKKPQLGIFSAAVLDFEPVRVKGKVSSSKTEWVIRLRPAPKILDEVGAKFPKMKRVGFKLETQSRSLKQISDFSLNYLKKKKLDFLVYNQLSEVSSAKHTAYLFSKDGSYIVAKSKKQIAAKVVQLIF